MRLAMLILFGAVLFALASVLALYSYGRFAERVQGESSAALPVAAGATPLDRFAAPLIAERPGESGLLLLESNLEAFAVRAMAARQSGRSLDLQYYIWDGDLTGRLLTNEVIAAADRGVRVRLLLDDINAQGFDDSWASLDTHPNIAVRLFNPSRNRDGVFRRALEMLLRAVSVTRRMHNKAWIADGRIAVIGGRNIGDAYFDAASTSNFRDLDLLLLGDAVRQTEVVFDDFWNSRAAIPIGALKTPRPGGLAALRERLAAQSLRQVARPYLERLAASDTMRGVTAETGALHWVRGANVVSDPPEKAQGDGGDDWLSNAIRPVLNSAEAEVEIISPYFIPGEAGTAWLLERAAMGVTTSILTNSLAATDVTAVHGAYARYRETLLAGGIRLFELRPYADRDEDSLFGSSGASLHTKSFTVDDRAGFVGSLNFDPRSISLNTEMGIIFEHGGLVGEIRRVFAEETAPGRSYRLEMQDGELVWYDEAGEGRRVWQGEPEASIWRRLAATVIGWLPIESQL